MKTIISKITGEKFYGKVVQAPCKVVRIDGELIDFWTFETVIDGDLYSWECHSDYWELIDSDLRKVSKSLRTNESQETNILNKIKEILKWGFCNIK